MPSTPQNIDDFATTVMTYYTKCGRHDMPWRQADSTGYFDPYKIMVSELMLQQTQVARVTPKYVAFLTTFPDVQTLAKAELGEVLKLWNGLGYNRRAKFIWQAARQVMSDYEGVFPDTLEGLKKLPGIGPNTAGAIMAYAYNQPVVFIETNIRTVIIHHFFKDQTAIVDTAIYQVLEAVMRQSSTQPRQFYWAMMDYGSHLKASIGNLSRASKHYTKQSTFQGSKRQLRGAVIRLLAEAPRTLEELEGQIADERLEAVLGGLLQEQMIVQTTNRYRLG